MNVLLSVLQLVDVDNDVTIHELAQTIIDIVGFRGHISFDSQA